jgi:hypothetical protein
MKNQPPNSNPPNRTAGTLAIGIMSLVLLSWSALVAWGAFQFQNTYDIRKPLIVLSVMSGFLGLWMTGLYLRRHRSN